MSVVSSPIQHSIAQAVHAQQVTAKAKEKDKAETSGARRFEDLVEVRVAGALTTDAVRQLPSNDSEQGDTERQGHQRQAGSGGEEPAKPRIDVKA
jgi:hypothetical protein